jgi:hypothetical protein
MQEIARLAGVALLALASAACHESSFRPTAPSSPFPSPAGWMPPAAIAPASVAGLTTIGVHLAGNAAGAALAVWEQRGPYSSRVLAMAFDPALGWREPQLLAADAAAEAGPRVALGPSGDGFALWVQRDVGGRSAVARRFVAGVGWDAPQALSGNDLVTEVDVAADAFGGAQALWAAGTAVRASRYVSGFGWRSAVTLSDPSSRAVARLPRLASSPDGSVVAVWEQPPRVGAMPEFVACECPAGGRWSAPLSLGAVVQRAGTLALAAGESREVTMAWTRRVGGSDTPAYARRFVPDVGWFEPVQLGQRATDARVAALPQAQALAAWTGFDTTSGETALRARHFRRADQWNPAVLVFESAGAFDVGAGAGGDAWALHDVWREGVLQVGARRWDGQWGPEQRLAPPAAPQSCPDRRRTGDIDPHVAVDGRGQALALWRRVDCEGEAFWSSRYLVP